MHTGKIFFATTYGLETRAFLLARLIPGEQMYTCAIDCWAGVLNHQEGLKNKDGPKCLFCYTSTIEPSIEVIDSMHPKFAWVSLKDGNSFMTKGTLNKIKHIVCAYMRSVKHPSAQALSSVTLSKKEIGWATRDNFTDCGIFAMRHMVLYYGKNKPFECGFNNDESVQQSQINNLRMKYCARILLSDANVFEDKVIADARNEANMAKQNEL
ncbi:putative papain-like cysteine peptidase superfamily [Helianthus anomalus]